MLSEHNERSMNNSSGNDTANGQVRKLPSNISLNDLRQKIAQSGERDLLFIEKNFDLAGALELRRLTTIQHVAEPLVPLGDRFAYFSPHKYQAAGAPYGSHGPFCLRQSVVERLNQAQDALEREYPGARLKIFDGFRPRSVQVYMRQLVHRENAQKLGFDPDHLDEQQSAAAWELVDRIWARPSTDPGLPTPHSTGSAIDVTIENTDGVEISMGSEMDEPTDRVLPSYYDHRANFEAVLFSENRELLRRVMENAGFHRLSHEWWHFSYGDQFWALVESLRSAQTVQALYGEYSE
jgi:D-alanyl-D-alanine dipeptidase